MYGWIMITTLIRIYEGRLSRIFWIQGIEFIVTDIHLSLLIISQDGVNFFTAIIKISVSYSKITEKPIFQRFYPELGVAEDDEVIIV